MTDDRTGPVVVVRRPSAGTAVSWYRDLAAASYPGKGLVVATAAGVTVPGYITDLPRGWVDAAIRAHEQLKADPAADMSRLATHQHVGPANGPLRPVELGKAARA